MSIRRTQQTVSSLWRAMESQLPVHQPVPQHHHPNPNHCNRARASPPPDPELANGNGYHYTDGCPPPQLSAEAMQPPRLQQSSCCGKLVLMLSCVFCLFLVLLAWTAFLSLPAVVEARALVSSQIAGPPQPERKPLPAILHRYATIRRVQKGQGRGADESTLRQAFPHWRGDDGQLRMEAVVSDVAMGLAAMVEQLDPSLVESRGAGAGALTAPPPEPVPPTPQSEEDTESTEL